MKRRAIRKVIVYGLGRDHHGRRLLQGITRYAHEFGPWFFFVAPDATLFARALRTWKADGVIYRGSPGGGQARRLRTMRTTVLQVAWPSSGPMLKHAISADLPRAGELAARHLLELGFRRFGYYGPNVPYCVARGDGFARALEDAGFACERMDFPPARHASPEKRISRLVTWLRRLRPPVALLIAEDAYGQRVSEACRRLRLRIPEDVAVVGISNDEIQCQMMWPDLTSVDTDHERVGYEAAGMLDALMHGLAVKPAHRLVAPRGIVVRHSTNTLAIEDPRIAAAVRFIHEACPRPVPVDELARRAGMSRRSLEQHFRAALRRSPAAEIRRLRIAHAQRLLLETPMKIAAVATECCYPDAKDFWQGFRKATGLSPRKFRQLRQTPQAPSRYRPHPPAIGAGGGV